MSRKILKHIDVELSTQSINNAIKEIRRFRTDLERTLNELVQALVNEGIEIAKMQVASMEAVYTGELEESIDGVFFPTERCGFVRANAPYAIFVEYGTGIVGREEPHPEAEGNYDYDIHHHGNEGWVYRNDRDGKFYWTKGFISRPFMYNTLRWLEEAAPDRASKFWTQM